MCAHSFLLQVILELERLGVRVVSGSRARVKEADAENAKGDKGMLDELFLENDIE